MLASMNNTSSSLRGGGCGTFRMIPRTQANLKSDIKGIENFMTKFDSFVEIICVKAAVINQFESQEIMLAIQWFIFQEENIYQLNKNAQYMRKSYNLIVEGIRKLLKSCLIYIRTDQFKCLHILQITASLSKVIFSFHVMNRDRIMKIDLQKEFLDISDDLKQLMEIEKNDLIQIQLEFFLFLTKTSFEIAPNNSKERKDIVKGFVSGIFGSLVQMKPNAELLESLFQAACQIHNMQKIKKNRKQYEVYFQIDMLQWEIIHNLKNDSSQNLEEIILQIEKTHEKLVKNSNNWKNHFLWIQMIGKILIYHPLITKEKLKQLTSSFNLEAKSMQIWKEYLNKGFLIQINHCNDQALILLNQFKNKELTQIDKLILEDTFKEWENLMVLKDFLLNKKNEKIHFTFGSYLKFKLGSINPNKDQNTSAICKIQQFFDFIISNKLLALIQDNDEKFGVIIKNYKNFTEKNKYFNVAIEQATYNSQLKKMVFSFKEYFQNTLKIIKIIRLSQRKQYCEIEQLEQKKINEQNLFQQLKYIMRLLEQILQQAIQDNRNEPDESITLQQEIEKIQKKLSNLNLSDKQFSVVNKLKQKLLALPSATLNKRSFLKEAQCMLKLIQKTERNVSELEVLLIKKENLIQYFQSLLNNLNFYYEHQIQELHKHFNELIESFKTIQILQYEIESVSQPEKLKEIKSQYSYKLSFQCIQKQRLNMQKLKLQLIAFKECFQNTLTIASEEYQKQQYIIKIDEFLLDVLCIFKNTFGEFQLFYNLKYKIFTVKMFL